MAYKLLLADDSITIQKVVELTLTEEGFAVTAVGDGAAALEAARRIMPDIVLADVFMPKMDGYELCERLRQEPALKGVPVILLAGTFEDYDEVKAARAGASDNLTKPFESADLISKVKRLVEAGAAQPAAFEAEPLEEAVAVFEAEEPEASDADDLWSVVDMGSSAQPLTGATQAISEDDLWKRANLLADDGRAKPAPKDDDPWAGFSAAPEPALPVLPEVEAVEVFEEDEPFAYAAVEEDEDTDKTAILDMGDLQASAFIEEDEPVASIDLSAVSAPAGITTFDRLEEAASASDFIIPVQPPPPAARPASGLSGVVSEEMIRAEVMKVAGAIIDMKVKEALTGISRDLIEQIVWEVVPELAEEIIQKEISRMKAGIG